ncbi:glycosyltransferase family 4 protein [Formicincola oecophyllae]|uniref:Glycosyltransferase family 4 protein n=1 Tax=Formicincola oecophyllae TaxID=2558361 RepID=A0A4Y6U7N2_9PROT|nr:glycosyltransferase family 1 protein [Formicincola oecophyllae]QDH13419.1 glycosyltransferase family 4 protein [Formicincola oecophyllae]
MWNHGSDDTTLKGPEDMQNNCLKGVRVGVDGFNMALPHGTGVARYGRTLARRLNELGAQVDLLFGLGIGWKDPEDLRETLFLNAMAEEIPLQKARFPQPAWFSETGRHLRGHVPCPIALGERTDIRALEHRLPPFDRIWNVPNLYRAASGFFRTTGRFLKVKNPLGVDVMHWTYPVPMRLDGARNIYTLHDTVPLTLPHTTQDNKRYYRKLLAMVCKKADALLTVSESSRKAVLDFEPASAPKLHNLGQSVEREEANYGDGAFHEPVFQGSVFPSLERKGYFLYYGALEPKKNIGRMVEAYLKADGAMPLVLVCGRAWKEQGETALLQQGVETGRIKIMDYLSERHLAALLEGARAFLFPSLAEGFGLPVLEAMQAGVPVMTSCEGALAEIGGKAVLGVNPYHVDEMAAAIGKLERSGELCAELTKKGLVQAKSFSPQHYRGKLVDFYKALGVVG